MTTVELGMSASENLLDTYFALGASSPSVSIRQEIGYRICVSQANHPISNFAAVLRLDPNAAARLAQIAAVRPCFHVYRLPSDQPRHAAELLYQAGFRVGHVLTQMAWIIGEELNDDHSNVHLDFAGTNREREKVAGFMTDQFFAKQPNSFRRQVLDGTSRADSLQLAWSEDRGRIVAAVMICESLETLGVYNLCVSTGMRNRGWGKRMIRTLKELAIAKRKPIVLQCEPSLVGWYRSQGFHSVGFVEVFSFTAGSALDII